MGSNRKFTDAFLQAIKPGETRREVFEAGRPGFGVRIGTRGKVTFIYLYRFEGKARRLCLGEYPAMRLAEAHQRHLDASRLLAEGKDPGRIEQTRKHEERLAPTVAQLVADYLERHAKVHKRSWPEDQRILGKDVLPALGERKAKEVTRRDIIALLDAIVARGAGIQANRTLACTRKLFNWATERGALEHSPCTGVKAPARERQRERVLSGTEIAAFWYGLDKTGMTKAVKLALRFQLVTAQRKGEVLAARWQDIELAGRMWTIPAAVAKNKLAHRVPLSDMAMAILEQARALAGDVYVFPSPKSGGCLSEDAPEHAIAKNRAAFGIEHFTPHDLRRTAASHMTAGGVSRLVVSKVLNHMERGITAVYDRHSYDTDKQAALATWGRRLERILGEGEAGNVVVFPGAKAET